LPELHYEAQIGLRPTVFTSFVENGAVRMPKNQ
jgi:hypothetical protein